MKNILSAILPTYNEAGHIDLLIKAVSRVLRSAGQEHEIIVVDDNSPDGTADKVKKAFSENKMVRLIVRKNERGLATAIKKGIDESKGDKILLMDTDFNHNPKDIIKLMKHSSRYPIVIGSRFVKGGGMKGGRFRYYGSYIFSMYARIVLGLKTKENQSGFLVIDRKMLDNLDKNKIFQGYGDYNLRLFYEAKKRNYKIKEVPVVYSERMSGESKTNLAKHLLQYSISVIRIRWS